MGFVGFAFMADLAILELIDHLCGDETLDMSCAGLERIRRKLDGSEHQQQLLDHES